MIPCNDEPCYFINIFTWMNGQETAPFYMSVQNGHAEMQYVTLRNGTLQIRKRRDNPNETFLERAQREFYSDSDDVEFRQKALQRSLYFKVLLRLTDTGDILIRKLRAIYYCLPGPHTWPQNPGPARPLCGGESQTSMLELCSSLTDRRRLSFSSPMWMVFFVSLSLWPLTSAVHDIALLHGCSPSVTLSWAWACLSFQGLIPVAALWVTADAVGVFPIAPRGHDEGCACYYKINDISALALLAAPLGLLLSYYSKYKLVLASVFSGDTLYYRQFYVPFGIVRGSPFWASPMLLLPQRSERRGFPTVFWTLDRSALQTSKVFAKRIAQSQKFMFGVSLALLCTKLVPKVLHVLLALLAWEDVVSWTSLPIVRAKNMVIKLLCLPASFTLYVVFVLLREAKAARASSVNRLGFWQGNCLFCWLTCNMVVCLFSAFRVLLPPPNLWADNQLLREDVHIWAASWSVAAFPTLFYLLVRNVNMLMQKSFESAVVTHLAVLDWKDQGKICEELTVGHLLEVAELFDPQTAALYKLDSLFKLARDHAAADRPADEPLDLGWRDALMLLYPLEGHSLEMAVREANGR